MAYTVEFAPEALEQLTAFYGYIATAASPQIGRYPFLDRALSRQFRETRQAAECGFEYPARS